MASIFSGRATGVGPKPIDSLQARQAFLFLADPEHSLELRGLPSGRSYVRHATDVDGLIQCASRLGDDRGIYYCLNPVRNGIGDRAARVADIVKRRWLLLDVDPVKPQEFKDASATDTEHEAARATASKVHDWLSEQGWPAPVLVDSGNGWHLLYRVDLPNNPSSQALIRRLLYAVAKRFDNVGATVDRSVHNASRIAKLPGTWARKGPSTAERPHRVCRLAFMPAEQEVVSLALLTAAGAEGEGAAIAPPPTPPPAQPAGSIFSGNAPSNGTAASYARAALRNEQARVALAVQGERNNALNRAAYSLGGLIAAGHLREDEAIEALREAANRAGLDVDPECGPKGIEATIRSGLEAGKSAPRTVPERNGTTGPAQAAKPTPTAWEHPLPLDKLPPPAPFPLDVFPVPIAEYVEQSAEATNSPPDFVAVPLLALAAGCIGASCSIGITRNHCQPATMYSVVVGLPGTGKSPALETVMEPLEEAEARYRADWNEKLRVWKLGKPDERGSKPALRRVFVDDTTSEALMRTLEANQRGVVMVRDELSALIAGFNQYKGGGKGNDRQVYLKTWSAATIRVDRKNNEDGMPLIIRRPSLSIVGGVQPDVIKSFLNADEEGRVVDDGLLDRFLFTYPRDKPAVEERFREVDADTADEWARVVQWLLSLEQWTDQDGVKRPKILKMSASGREAWVDFTRLHAAELNTPDFPDWKRGPWSKLRGYGARLALVMHLLECACDNQHPGDVGALAVERAGKLVAYFKAHYLRAATQMGADPRVAEAMRVLAWLKRNPGIAAFSQREAYRILDASFATPESLYPAMRLLTVYGYLRLATPEDTPMGRKPGPRWEVSPLWERDP